MPKRIDIDFPTGRDYSDHYAGVRPKPETPAPKTKRVRMPDGSWKYLVVGPIDDTNTDLALQNMKDLGIRPTLPSHSPDNNAAPAPAEPQTNTILVGTGAPQQVETVHAALEKKPRKKKVKVPGRIKGQADFFDTVPEFQLTTPPRDPEIVAANDEAHLGRIHQRAQSTYEKDRARIVQPDIGHDQTNARKEWRKANGLPERARSWKELQVEFDALPDADKVLLKDMGFRPDLVRNHHSRYVERMLHALHQRRKP